MRIEPFVTLSPPGGETFVTSPPFDSSLDVGVTNGISDYIDHMGARGLSSNTIEQRLRFAHARWQEWGTWDLPGHEIAAWLADYDGWTRLTYHNHLTSLFAWLCDAGLRDEDPMRQIRRPPTPRPSPKPLTEDELGAALASADWTVRTYLMLGYLAGLRAFEIAKVSGRDVTATGIYVMGKGGQGATVPTHPLLWDLAQQYPREGYWFPSPCSHREHIHPGTVTQRIRRLFVQLGISGATHRTRHTYGTQLLRGGANLRVVQDLMRHSSLSTTAVYLGVDEDERVRAIRGLAA